MRLALAEDRKLLRETKKWGHGEWWNKSMEQMVSFVVHQVSEVLLSITAPELNSTQNCQSGLGHKEAFWICSKKAACPSPPCESCVTFQVEHTQIEINLIDTHRNTPYIPTQKYTLTASVKGLMFPPYTRIKTEYSEKMAHAHSLSVHIPSLFFPFFLRNINGSKTWREKQKTPILPKFVPKWVLVSRGKRNSMQILLLSSLPLLPLWKPAGPWEMLAEPKLLTWSRGAEPDTSHH